MNYRMSFVLMSLAVALAFCVPSSADSDGSFCASRGYLAYELRDGITPGVAEHVLRVVRFEPKLGIYIAGEVTLQDFQVHHMTCSQDRVEISDWGNIFKKYAIEIAGSQKVHILAYTEDPTRRFDASDASKEGPAPPQLGFGQPTTIGLESSDPDHKYQLLLSRSEKPVEGGLENPERPNSSRSTFREPLHSALCFMSAGL